MFGIFASRSLIFVQKSEYISANQDKNSQGNNTFFKSKESIITLRSAHQILNFAGESSLKIFLEK